MKPGGNLKLAALAVGIGLISAPATAHDPSKHKGRATKGEIVAVTANQLQLKTEKGDATVLLTEKPKIEVGEVQASADALKNGEQVVVFGTTLASGEIVAREIVVAEVKGGKGGHPHNKGSSHGH